MVSHLAAKMTRMHPSYLVQRPAFLFPSLVLSTADQFDPDRFLDERLHKYLVPNPSSFYPLTLALDGVGLMSGISVRVQRGIVFPHSAVAVDRWCLTGHGDATPPSGGLGAGQGT